MYRVDVRGPGANRVTALPTDVRQELLRQLGALAELADEQGLEAFAPRANLWIDFGQLRILYTLDVKKKVLSVVEVISRE